MGQDREALADGGGAEKKDDDGLMGSALGKGQSIAVTAVVAEATEAAADLEDDED